MKTLARIYLILMIATLSSGAQAGVYDDMIVAVRNDDGEKVISLLQRGMDVNTADQNGNTLAMFAARSGNEKLLDYLLRNRANILIKNANGDTAILLAALQGHLGCVKLLTRAGAEINPRDGEWSPLTYAAFAGKTEIAAYLLELGARIDARAPNGMTSLMLAARNGHVLLVRHLLDHRADINLKTSEGKTALDIARSVQQTQVMELLETAAKAQGS